MGMTGLKSLDQSLVKTKEWLKDVQQELHYEDEQEAYVAARAVLHALRDRLTVEEAADLAAQLPVILTGVYYENWKPANKPLKIRDEAGFFEQVAGELPQNRQYDSGRITKGFFKALQKHISGGQLEEIKNSFPGEMRGIFG
ncbi:MAG: DUF2267 domain-containing protein [Candidatus Omnitrophica bacterium]|nr:DUF2267 domain-containing protein [Candidatus Omnitrophota bacterium]